jgi:putative membrane protein insertion efficiency factor
MKAWPQAALIGAVRAYRFFLSPWLGNACRFEPTCSAYALEALGRHGAGAGLALTVGRIGRCHPWCQGGFDPVPATPPRLFTALLGRASSAATSPRASSDSTS